ncbi:MAG: ATP-binding protein [Sedimentitalea sp.]
MTQRAISLKLRLSIAAAMLGAGTIVTALILYLGLNDVARRLDTALASEVRMARYASLSTQAATFLVVATEAVQTGLSPDVRIDRMSPVVDQLRRTFVRLHSDVEAAVLAARDLGIDEQSRYATQSLGIARMQAMLNQTISGLQQDTTERDRLRAHIDSFASRFDPLLGQAVNTERLFRSKILSGIDALRQRLVLIALFIVGATVALVSGFYFGLIRPQFRRLDALRDAAHRIAREDFSVSLPVERRDEIGQLLEETNQMAAALAERRDHVQTEWARLNDTIAARTKELRNANATLEEIDENRRRFFADISHELRTPLTVILLEAQIGKQAAPEAASAFETIGTRAERLNRRIDDLLRLARSDTGQLALDPQAVALAALARDVQVEIQAEIDSAGMVLRVDAMPDLKVICDPNWVRQVVVGLIRNAIRHARSGTHLALQADQDATLAGLVLVDNGPGIAPDQQAHIFQRFVQGAPATSAQGFGIGLALARWVIDAQNGQITLTSPVPRACALGDAPGTKIAVCLPRVQE